MSSYRMTLPISHKVQNRIKHFLAQGKIDSKTATFLTRLEVFTSYPRYINDLTNPQHLNVLGGGPFSGLKVGQRIIWSQYQEG